MGWFGFRVYNFGLWGWGVRVLGLGLRRLGFTHEHVRLNLCTKFLGFEVQDLVLRVWVVVPI